MTGIGDRRTILRLALAAAVAPAFASRLQAAAAAAPRRFSPPAGAMTFTRRLVRTLADGNRVVVDRAFAIRFVARAPGWSVAGEQTDVAVDFPPRLAPLAGLERQRREVDLFPLLLDARGRIVEGPRARPAKELDQAVAIVTRAFGQAPHTADERAEHEAFVSAVHDAGARMTSLPPAQLFAPDEPESRAERDLVLPAGGRGTIAVSFSALADPQTGLMRQARRDIVTTIAGDSRLTREDWTLTPI